MKASSPFGHYGLWKRHSANYTECAVVAEPLDNLIVLGGRKVGEIYGLHQKEAASLFLECLEKPFEPNVLLERVARALSGGS